MIAMGYRLPVGEGLIGIAAATGQSILQPNLADDPSWQPDTLLPETQGEIAVPIKLRETVLGVLHVLSNKAGALSQTDQILLEGLCGQIAIAIEDSRLRKEMEERLHELNQLYQNTTRQGWQTFQDTVTLPAYLYDKATIQALNGAEAQSIENIGNFLTTPLALRGSESIGSLGVFNNPEKPLTEDDISFIEQIAEQVALALESARLFTQTQRALAETDALYNIISDLNAARDYDAILTVLAKRTILSGADQSLLMFFFDSPLSTENTPDWVIPIAWRVHASIRIADRYPLSAFEFEPNTLFTHSTVVLEDISNDNRVDRLTRTLFQDVFHAQSSIITPLMVGEQSLGFILGNFGELRKFGEAEVQRLSTIASQVAIAVQGMQLLEQTLARARREQLLREVTNQVNSAAGTDAILRRAVEQVGRALRRPVYVYLESKKVLNTSNVEESDNNPNGSEE